MHALSFKKIFSLTLLSALLLLFALLTEAAWTGPTATAPNGNVAAPLNVGTTDQVKDAGISVNALAVFGSQYIQNKLGINVTNPLVALDVAGTLKLGDGGEQCQSISEGAVAYSNADKCLRYCDGSNWLKVCGASAAQDTATAGTQLSILDKLGGYTQGQCYSGSDVGGNQSLDFSVSQAKTLQVEVGCVEQGNGSGQTSGTVTQAQFWLKNSSGTALYASPTVACTNGYGTANRTPYSLNIPQGGNYRIETAGAGCNGPTSDQLTVNATLYVDN